MEKLTSTENGRQGEEECLKMSRSRRQRMNETKEMATMMIAKEEMMDKMETIRQSDARLMHQGKQEGGQQGDQTSGPSSGSAGPAPHSHGVEVPVPVDASDDELMVDDVYLSEVPGLPEGWVIVDGDLELADAWVVQNRTFARTRPMRR